MKLRARKKEKERDRQTNRQTYRHTARHKNIYIETHKHTDTLT